MTEEREVKLREISFETEDLFGVHNMLFETEERLSKKAKFLYIDYCERQKFNEIKSSQSGEALKHQMSEKTVYNTWKQLKNSKLVEVNSSNHGESIITLVREPFEAGYYFVIHKTVWKSTKLSQEAKMVYTAICKYAKRTTQKSFPAMTTLEREAGISRPTLNAALKELINIGLIHMETGRKKVNTKGKIEDDTHEFTLLEIPEVFALEYPIKKEQKENKKSGVEKNDRGYVLPVKHNKEEKPEVQIINYEEKKSEKEKAPADDRDPKNANKNNNTVNISNIVAENDDMSTNNVEKLTTSEQELLNNMSKEDFSKGAISYIMDEWNSKKQEKKTSRLFEERQEPTHDEVMNSLFAELAR